MTQRSLRVAILAALAVAVWARPGHAADVKIYQGGFCQPFTPSDAANFDYFAASVDNISASATSFLVCPIITDNSVSGSGTDGVAVRVQSSNGANLPCNLESYSKFGTFLESSAQASTTSNTPVALSLDVNSNGPGGHYVLYCNMPPGSRLFNYRVVESSPTD